MYVGRGKPYQNHPGNIRLHQVVQHHKARYAKAKRQDKVSIAAEVLELIKDFKPPIQLQQQQQHEEGVRFLRRAVTDEGEQYWTVVKHTVALDKVGHALRGKGIPKSQEMVPSMASSVPSPFSPSSSSSAMLALRGESQESKPLTLPLYHQHLALTDSSTWPPSPAPNPSTLNHQQQQGQHSTSLSSQWIPTPEGNIRQQFIDQISQLNTDTLAIVVQNFCGGGRLPLTQGIQYPQQHQQQQQQQLLQVQSPPLSTLAVPPVIQNSMAAAVSNHIPFAAMGGIPLAPMDHSQLNAALAALSASQQQQQQQQGQIQVQLPPPPLVVPSSQNIGVVDSTNSNTQLLANFLLQQPAPQQQPEPLQPLQQQQQQQLMLPQGLSGPQYLQLMAALQSQGSNDGSVGGGADNSNNNLGPSSSLPPHF